MYATLYTNSGNFAQLGTRTRELLLTRQTLKPFELLTTRRLFQFIVSLLDYTRLGFLQHHMVADLNEKRRPQLEGRLRAGNEGYDGNVESVSEDLRQKD